MFWKYSELLWKILIHTYYNLVILPLLYLTLYVVQTGKYTVYKFHTSFISFIFHYIFVLQLLNDESIECFPVYDLSQIFKVLLSFVFFGNPRYSSLLLSDFCFVKSCKPSWACKPWSGMPPGRVIYKRAIRVRPCIHRLLTLWRVPLFPCDVTHKQWTFVLLSRCNIMDTCTATKHNKVHCLCGTLQGNKGTHHKGTSYGYRARVMSSGPSRGGHCYPWHEKL